MKNKSLTERLIYLDADFISRLYESEFDISPQIQVTRTQGVQASASLALFTGEGSFSESRSYGISVSQMLDQLSKRLSKYPFFSNDNYAIGQSSAYSWVDGVLSMSKVRLTRTNHAITLVGKPDPQKPTKTEELVGEEAFFSIKNEQDRFALSSTDQYFVYGMAAFKGLSHIVIDQLSIPCRALLRVFSARTSFAEWVVTPLVIYDSK